MGPFWQDCGPSSAGRDYFRHFPAQRAGRFAFVHFLRAKLAYGQAAGALTCQPGDVSAAINRWQSGPCGPPLWPLRALPRTSFARFAGVSSRPSVSKAVFSAETSLGARFRMLISLPSSPVSFTPSHKKSRRMDSGLLHN
jgi:hypothetical protein